MKKNNNEEFNFDEWAQLAKQDGEIFETKRSEYINQFIDQVPEKHLERIIGLQWKLDMERQLAVSSLASCQNMYNQMWESVIGVDGLYDQINSLLLYMNSPDAYSESISNREKESIKADVVSLF